MTLIELLKQETAGSRTTILFVAGLSGIANAGLLAIINSAVQSPSADMQSLRSLLMYAVVLAVYAVCFRYTAHQVTVIIEDIVSTLRVRIADKIRHADLFDLERIEQGEIFNLLTGETRAISEASGILASALQTLMLVVFAIIYLVMLSLPAFLLCLVLIGGSLWLYLYKLKEVQLWMQQTAQQEIQCFNTLRDLLDGFKAVKLNADRSRDLMSDITETTETLREMKVHTADLFNVNYIVAYVTFYITLAAVAFLLPRLLTFQKEDLTRVVMTVLFLTGPLGVLVSGAQALSRANAAMHNIDLLEQRLDRVAQVRRDGAATVSPRPPAFTDIQLQEVIFQYVDQEGNETFRVGPLNLAIKRGEILFVMGGNGSGKTTFLKLLTALYFPTAGRLLVDNTPIGEAQLRSYRALFAVIFADFHLFRKLYGLLHVSEEAVEPLLAQFYLEDKTAFATDHFTNLQLSTGQRKRLAMIVALLEDRPVYIFDEWAADQDPEFRQYFYEQLLPELVARGKTVVAVTHDERYLSVAHRVIKMELGHIDTIVSAAPGGEVHSQTV